MPNYDHSELNKLLKARRTKTEQAISDWLLDNNAVRLVGNNGKLADFTQKSIRELSKEITSLIDSA
tara:strand:- start:318 stop:515 length:198 start_codon:yes stop_codon:yes gene_type:complete